MTPDAVLYQKNVHSIFLTGDKGEYELLAYHYPLLGIIKDNIIVDWTECIRIKSGIVKFFANECMILAEEHKKERVRTSQLVSVENEKEEGEIVADVDMDHVVH
jgi:F0F1-type ATP synthase epsilon subunit